MNSYRIFVSYYHEDMTEVEIVRKYLKNKGQIMMSDHNLTPGMAFTDEIKRYIAYSHLFIPIITKESNKSPWVHQEIGYAMGLGIPVLPLAVGQFHEGMVQYIQAVTVDDDSNKLESNLKVKLTEDVLQQVVDRAEEITTATSQCAENLIDRTKMIVRYANDVRYLGKSGRVRMRSAFGSFAIPNEHPSQESFEIYDSDKDRTSNMPSNT